MNLKFTNNAAAKLASSISSTSTQLTVESGKGSLFPAITSPQYFYVTIVGDDKMEIVKVTERSTDTFTIVRAQDNTTASAFSAGDVVELRITAAAFNDISTALDELDAFPEQSGNSGKYLTTDGTNVSWASIDTYPSQSGNAGASLITDGESTLWHPVAQDVLDAARIVATGSEEESDIYEPLIGTVAHEMGSWWISLDNSIPVGGLPHLGHLCSRATYGDFWTWCELNKTVVSEEEWLAYADSHNGCCPYYSYGDGSTTFRTPKYDQSFLKVLASIGDTGKIEEAGLPNIIGTTDATGGSGRSTFPTGPFTHTPIIEDVTVAVNNNTEIQLVVTNFDASLSNPIYGNSDTVTPQNFGIIVGVYAVGAVSAPIGETDAANLLNGLTTLEAGKASVDLSNLSTAGRSLAAGLGMPSYRYIDLTLGASEATYTAPSDGWLIFAGSAASGSSGSAWVLISGPCGNMTQQGISSGAFAVYAPFTKGQNFTVQYNNITMSDSWARFRFIYAEGAE